MHWIYQPWDRLRQTPLHLWPIYYGCFWSLGFFLTATVEYHQVARFYYAWQVLTCYGLYVIPLAALIRTLPWHAQYAYSVAAFAPLEIIAYRLGSSLAIPGNFIEAALGENNFCLTVVVIFGAIPVVGNTIVEAVGCTYLLFRKLQRERMEATSALA